ncbi:proteinase inhibitor [Trametopsis cervina]|nr:proteinase inhibitor [Trametopsis cervina]
MSLPTGTYEIRSAVNDQFWVGRPLAEDHSLLPKPITTLPKDQIVSRPWLVVQSDGENQYILKVGGDPTAEIDNKLFAVLLPEPPATVWKLTPVSGYGDNAFAVSIEGDVRGWVVPDEELFTQIAVRPLIVGPSEPPFYPPTEVFIFNRVGQD